VEAIGRLAKKDAEQNSNQLFVDRKRLEELRQVHKTLHTLECMSDVWNAQVEVQDLQQSDSSFDRMMLHQTQ